MKPRKSSPHKDELGIMEFVPIITKPTEKGVILNIGDSDSSVKLGIGDLMMAFGKLMHKGLPGLARLQRKTREGRDG